MAIQFPSPVADGYSFTAENGVVYTYDSSGGGGWYAYHPDGLNDVYVNIDGDTMTGDLTVPSLNGGPLAGLRNQIINGSMEIHQRQGNSDALIAGGDAGYRSADRWALRNNNESVVDVDNSLVGVGFSSVLRVKRDSGDIDINQGIELPMNNLGTQAKPGPFVNGSTWSISFWADTEPSLVGASFAESVTSTSAGADDNEFTVTRQDDLATEGTYTRYHYTFVVDVDRPTPTSDVNMLKIMLRFPSSGTFVRLTGVQVEIGPVATVFEHRPIGMELQLCQRYYQTYERLMLLVRTSNAADRSLRVPRITTMRAAPTEAGTATNTSTSSIFSGQASELRMYAQATNEASVCEVRDYTADAEL